MLGSETAIRMCSKVPWTTSMQCDILFKRQSGLGRQAYPRLTMFSHRATRTFQLSSSAKSILPNQDSASVASEQSTCDSDKGKYRGEPKYLRHPIARGPSVTL